MAASNASNGTLIRLRRDAFFTESRCDYFFENAMMKQQRVPFLTIAFNLAIVVSASSCSKIDAFRDPQLYYCEAFVKETLSSPSSYRKIKSTESFSEMGATELLLLHKPECRDIMAEDPDGNKSESALCEYELESNKESGKGELIKVRTIFLTYEAVNSFNAPLKLNQSCTFAPWSFDEKSSFNDSMIDLKLSSNKSSCCL
jgi:hypothetical protein